MNEFIVQQFSGRWRWHCVWRGPTKYFSNSSIPNDSKQFIDNIISSAATQFSIKIPSPVRDGWWRASTVFAVAAVINSKIQKGRYTST